MVSNRPKSFNYDRLGISEIPNSLAPGVETAVLTTAVGFPVSKNPNSCPRTRKSLGWCIRYQGASSQPFNQWPEYFSSNGPLLSYRNGVRVFAFGPAHSLARSVSWPRAIIQYRRKNVIRRRFHFSRP